MFRSRLAVKIGLLIVAVLIVGFGASTLVAIQRESTALIGQNKIAARRLTATVVASVEGAVFPPVHLHMGVSAGEAPVGATRLGTGAGRRWTFTATGPAAAERIRARFVLESLGEKTFENVSQPIRVFRVIPPGIYEKTV